VSAGIPIEAYSGQLSTKVLCVDEPLMSLLLVEMHATKAQGNRSGWKRCHLAPLTIAGLRADQIHEDLQGIISRSRHFVTDADPHAQVSGLTLINIASDSLCILCICAHTYCYSPHSGCTYASHAYAQIEALCVSK